MHARGLARGGMSINSPQRGLGPEDSPVPSIWVSLHSCLWHVGMQRQAHCFGVDQSLRGSRTGRERNIGNRGGRCLPRSSL